MRIPTSRAPIFAAVLGLVSHAVAQVERYELGLRLRDCERRLGACDDAAKRRAALAEMNGAVQAFFRLDTAAVARAIDTADRALGGADDAEARFAQSLQLVLPQRLHDVATAELPFVLSLAYDADQPLPEAVVLAIMLDAETKPRLQIAVDAMPFAGTMPLGDVAPGDHTLRWSLQHGDRQLTARQQGVSLAADVGTRLVHLESAAEQVAERRTLETQSLQVLTHMLRVMTRRRGEETVLPGARLLVDAEALATAITADEPFYGPARAGEHWLGLPVGRRNATLRFLVPPDTRTDAPRPLVLALHGAGGSENLFFDGYGDGAIVRLCRERGWYLAAPRSEALGGADLPGLIDALAARWPIDRTRVLLIGHSMGAAQAVAAAAKNPDRFAAVAALGGGGSLGRSPRLQTLPFFVGVGERDFLGQAARSLSKTLQDAGAPTTFREYPDVEHLTVVQFALPDVFRFFDATLAAKSTQAPK